MYCVNCMNKFPKYAVNDIFEHKEFKNYKLIIIYVLPRYTNENPNSNEIFYMTNKIENDRPPTPIEEKILDEYYIKVVN